MNKTNEITLQRNETIKIIITNDLLEVGFDEMILEMTEEQTMQLGKLAMDIANSSEIKELSLKLEKEV